MAYVLDCVLKSTSQCLRKLLSFSQANVSYINSIAGALSQFHRKVPCSSNLKLGLSF